VNAFFYFQNMTQKEFQTIQNIGRKGMIEEIRSVLTQNHPAVTFGIGDDAAVITPGAGKKALLSSETFIEGIDFDITYTPLKHLGHKIVSSAVSDIFAMNGRPVALSVNLAVPNKYSVQMIRELFTGVDAACEYYSMQLVGGDLNGNYSGLTLSVHVYGEADEDKLVYRSGAAVDDAICLSGDLGGAIAGLRILMREKMAWQESGQEHFTPDLSEYEYVVRRQLMPQARLDVIDTFSKLHLQPTSMIDITKGLSNEVIELCTASKKGCRIFEAAVPIAIESRNVANELQEDVSKYAFFGGEDLELLFTLPAESVEEFGKHFSDFSVIGKIAPENEGLLVQTAEGELLPIDELSY
jgi:thiamine-monophosphate kinase